MYTKYRCLWGLNKVSQISVPVFPQVCTWNTSHSRKTLMLLLMSTSAKTGDIYEVMTITWLSKYTSCSNKANVSHPKLQAIMFWYDSMMKNVDQSFVTCHAYYHQRVFVNHSGIEGSALSSKPALPYLRSHKLWIWQLLWTEFTSGIHDNLSLISALTLFWLTLPQYAALWLHGVATQKDLKLSWPDIEWNSSVAFAPLYTNLAVVLEDTILDTEVAKWFWSPW